MKKIAMVVGEDFWLRIPMNNESAGRHLCMDDVEVIHAWLESGYGGCWTLPLVTDGEQLEGVAVKVPGSRLGLGTYAVVMAGKFVNGDHFRTKRQLFIRLVDREDQADAKPTMFNEEKAYWAGPAVLSGMLSRDGLNTYELAVLHGFGGTLEEFLAQQGIELQDLMVTKAKLSREVQTQLDKGSEKAITPAGDYDDETKYSVNEMVYDEETNSSYVSKQSENVGHAVTDTAWWMKVLDGNYVQTTIQAIMTAAQATLDAAKQNTLDATAAALAAKQATEQATAAANAVAAQKVADAQIGYYVCETAAGTATKQTTSDVIGEDHFAVPYAGGAVKVSMKYANTSTDAVYLQFGTNTNTKRKLYYNGLPVDDSNTWEDEEVISVYLDPAANNGAGGYMASNAQGGGGKAEKIKYDNSQSGLAAENLQAAIDETNILNAGENVFDITTSESSNPSSSNFSVAFDTANETVTVTTSKKISSDSVKGGFTTGLGAGINYRYSFDYVNQINGAHCYQGGIDRGALVVGSGSIVFDSDLEGNLLVSLPNNTASGKSVVFSNINIVHVDYLKDTVNKHSTRLDTDETAIDVLKKDVTSKPLTLSYDNMTQGNGIISPTNHTWSTNSGYKHYYFARTSDMKEISIQGNGSTSSYISFLKSYDYEGTPSGTPVYCDGYSAPVTFTPSSTPSSAVRIPDDCNFIVINKQTSSSYLPAAVYLGYAINSVVEYKDNTVSTHRIDMEVGNFNINTGMNTSVSYDATTDVRFDSGDGYAFKTTDGEFLIWRSAGLVTLEGGSYTVTFDKGDRFLVVLYNDKREVIQSTEYNDTQSITFDSLDAKYARFLAYKKSETYPDGQPYVRFCEPKVTISGIFTDGLKIAKLGKQDNTCDTIIYPVWIENTYCCEGATTDLQDDGEWHIDFGRIRFPENYDPDGEPVRMIIWCHGGTPRYNPVYSGDSDCTYVAGNFDTSGHINPTMFLAEGYAVMDIDGVFAIFNEKADSDGIKANSVLQTARCYQAAYDYVTRNYNIRTDGVLLGGVSFGGSKSLQIITHSHIPVIAAALESPFIEETRFWYNGYRALLGKSAGIDGLHYGLTPSEDIETLKDNYGKMLRVSPILGTCHVSKEEFFATTHVDGVGDLLFNAVSLTENRKWLTNIVAKWAAHFPVPIKIWCCTADETSVPDYCGKILYAIGSNGGSDIELRMIEGGGHTPSTGGGSGQLNISNYVTKYGQTLASVPLVYAEAVRFWRRHEQKKF